MIPEFPQFKSLELSDKKDVESFTEKFPPYSDFNFVSMWSWDIKKEMQISKLNNNLVVRFNDYITGEPFFSFLGGNQVNETVEKLFELSKKEGLKAELKLIPEEAVKGLNTSKFKITEDRDHFDYIYNIEELFSSIGSRYRGKRADLGRFLRKYPNINYKIIDITNTKIKSGISFLNREWFRNKKNNDPYFKIENELIAMDRFLNTKDLETYSIGVFSEGVLIGYLINGIIDKDFVISHFMKADVKFSGIYSFLANKSCELFLSLNKKFLNYEQDLGVDVLRKSKMSNNPAYFLKKYVISL